VFSLAVILTALVPAWANAAWLGYKNDTTALVVIQAADVVIVNGKVQQLRTGKQHPLYPGEVAMDAVAAPGPRLIMVYDPKQNMKPVFRDQVNCNGKDDIFLSLRLVTPPAARGQPQQPPQLGLVPIPLNQLPRGLLPPGSTPGAAPPSAPPTSKAPTTPPPANPPAGNPPPGRGGPPAGKK
jgi:hypothetical protein